MDVLFFLAAAFAAQAGGLPPVPSVRSLRPCEGVYVLRSGTLSEKSVAKTIDASIAPE